jgi:hypothetical protein
MATMRSGLDSWLKQDCINNAEIVIEAIRDNDIAQNNWTKGRDDAVIRELDALKSDIAKLPYTSDQIIAIIQLRDKLASMDNDRNSYGEAMKTFNEINDRLYRHLLETTVNCQCGKQINNDTSKTLLHTGSKVKVKKGAGLLSGSIGTVIERYTGGGYDNEWKIGFDSGRTEVLSDHEFESEIPDQPFMGYSGDYDLQGNRTRNPGFKV